MGKQILAAFFLLPAFAALIQHEIISSILAVFWMLIVVPVGILQLIDFYKHSKSETLAARSFRILLKIPIGLFGLVSLVSGVSIIVWVLYNMFVERQKEFRNVVVGFGVAPALVVFGWYLIRVSIHRDYDEISEEGIHPNEYLEDEEFDDEKIH